LYRARSKVTNLTSFDIKLREKLLCTFLFYKNADSCRNFLQIFFYIIHNVKIFHLTFNDLISEVRPQQYPSTAPPPSAWFYCYFTPPKSGSSPDRLWSRVWHGASQDTNQFLVRSHRGCGGVAGFQLCLSLALSKWAEGTVLSFWANSQNCSALLHTLQMPGGVNLNLIKVRSKLSKPRHLTVLLDPV
jgi:hypothetical protein